MKTILLVLGILLFHENTANAQNIKTDTTTITIQKIVGDAAFPYNVVYSSTNSCKVNVHAYVDEKTGEVVYAGLIEVIEIRAEAKGWMAFENQSDGVGIRSFFLHTPKSEWGAQFFSPACEKMIMSIPDKEVRDPLLKHLIELR